MGGQRGLRLMPDNPRLTPDDLQALRAEHDALVGRVKRLEALVADRTTGIEREIRAGFQAINARFDGMEAELRYRFEQLDRLEEGQAQLSEGVRYLTSFLRDRVKGR
jgi:hypothetical protein